MALYNISNKKLYPIDKTTYSYEGLLERSDLQQAIKNEIEIIAPDCLVISEEFSDWDESKRRIDILAIDKQANLVVIELKRDEVGAHMELQALRYASMISTMSFNRACEYYQSYLDKNTIELNAKEEILKFLELNENEFNDFGNDVRIILASADFGKELTTTVIWLREKGVDISCVKITPYNFNGNILINSEQIIPTPELAEYQVKFREKQQEQTTLTNKFKKDYSRYIYKGETFNKRNLALALFTDWIEKNKPKDLDDIKMKFGNFINNRTLTLTEHISEKTAVRYHCNEEDFITIDSGEIIAVSNQWTEANLDKVIEFLKGSGFMIEKVD